MFFSGKNFIFFIEKCVLQHLKYFSSVIIFPFNKLDFLVGINVFFLKWNIFEKKLDLEKFWDDKCWTQKLFGKK